MDFKIILEYGAILFGFAVTFGIFKNTIDNLKDENRQQWIVITKIRDSSELREKEESMRWLEAERNFGKVRENAGKIEAQLSELVRLIKNLDDRLEKWIDKQK